MTDTREELLAKRAEIDAKLAALDAPHWICSGIPDEAVEAGIAAWDKAKHDLENYTSGETADWDEGMIVCAIYKAMAPLIPAPLPMGEDEIEALARECAQKARDAHHGDFLNIATENAARLAIRETLRRVPAWPGEEELREMAYETAEACRVMRGPDAAFTVSDEEAALEMARRLKARMGAGGGAKIEPYIVYADDEGWFDWHGGECPVPAGTRVGVRFRIGGENRLALASIWVWEHDDHPYDIVAYRILSGEEA
jgi:hypothetical protein